jgi:hypothetical protein
MHNSLIVRIAVMLLIPTAAFLGFFLHEVIYTWDATLPYIPMAITATIILMMWAVMDLLDY